VGRGFSKDRDGRTGHRGIAVLGQDDIGSFLDRGTEQY
jgi:hypothetical protein